MEVQMRLLCLLIGYLFGSFLTAEVVTRRETGRPCSELGGTGNPGMANVMTYLGFKAGVVVLIGDILKTAFAVGICEFFISPIIGRVARLYAGFGAVLGHDFPLWLYLEDAVYRKKNGKNARKKKSSGGKGVTCCCTALILFAPFWGTLACVIGLVVVLISQYLCVGGALIPAAFIVPAFWQFGFEAGILTMILFLLCLIKHYPAIKTIPSGTCEKTDVAGKIRSLFSHSH